MIQGTLKGKQMWSNGQTSMMASVCKESEVQFGDYVKRPKRPGEWPDRCDGKCLHLPAGLEQHGKGGHWVERSGAFRKWRSEQERLITRITLPLFLFFSAKCRMNRNKHPMTKREREIRNKTNQFQFCIVLS